MFLDIEKNWGWSPQEVGNMKVEKLKEFFNTYFKEIGEKNINEMYFLDEPLEVRLVDVKFNKAGKRYHFFFDTEPERLPHTIEYDDGSLSGSVSKKKW